MTRSHEFVVSLAPSMGVDSRGLPIGVRVRVTALGQLLRALQNSTLGARASIPMTLVSVECWPGLLTSF